MGLAVREYHVVLQLVFSLSLSQQVNRNALVAVFCELSSRIILEVNLKGKEIWNVAAGLPNLPEGSYFRVGLWPRVLLVPFISARSSPEPSSDHGYSELHVHMHVRVWVEVLLSLQT